MRCADSCVQLNEGCRPSSATRFDAQAAEAMVPGGGDEPSKVACLERRRIAALIPHGNQPRAVSAGPHVEILAEGVSQTISLQELPTEGGKVDARLVLSRHCLLQHERLICPEKRTHRVAQRCRVVNDLYATPAVALGWLEYHREATHHVRSRVLSDGVFFEAVLSQPFALLRLATCCPLEGPEDGQRWRSDQRRRAQPAPLERQGVWLKHGNHDPALRDHERTVVDERAVGALGRTGR
mmetsp:Transcript_8564/g.25242  ORF Transcript_8564/g.25242 Transcript_8564/m.25242 type:complete len:239 (+) Transcript_8564:383-1099(+)